MVFLPSTDAFTVGDDAEETITNAPSQFSGFFAYDCLASLQKALQLTVVTISSMARVCEN